jgi:NADPH-dependent 2,4-dienoyl-CoA reductase/sulfur reductase-like enzyme
MREMSADLLIVGGGLGGVAAALAGARGSRSVVLTEETDWLGGQITSQAVPPDEHPWIERFGCPLSYRRLRDGIRRYYGTTYPLSSAALSEPHLNPGSGHVSRLCHEPRVALAVIEAMLAPFRSPGRVTVLTDHSPVAVETSGDRVEAVTLGSPL